MSLSVERADTDSRAVAEEHWQLLRAEIRSSVGRPAFDFWFSNLEPLRLHGDVLYLTGPRHVVAWVERRYEDVLARCLRSLGGSVAEVRMIETESVDVDREPRRTQAEPAVLRNQTFERFIIGPGNRVAHGAALAVAEAPGEAYNPLFLHGDPGLGKTHLLSAIAAYIDRTSPEKRIHSTTAESFTAEFIQALQAGGIEDFKDRYRRVDVLLIDDVQFLEGKARTADEFFHTFNSLHMSGAQIVLSADRMPSELSTLADRLRERFEWGLVVDIDRPDLATRRAFLETFARCEGLTLDEATVGLLADYSLASLRAVEGALTRVMARSSLVGGQIDSELVREVLGPTGPDANGKSIGLEETRAITLEEVERLVSELFSVSVEELRSASRVASVSRARQVAMSLSREFTGLSLPAIARAFGRRDHTTVIHAIKTVEKKSQDDPHLSGVLEEAKKRLSQD